MHFANCFDFLFAFPLEAFEAYLVFISSLTAGIRVEISWKRGRRNNFINTGSDRHHHQLSYSHWICLVWARHFFSYNFAYLSRKVIFQILHRELWFLQVRSKNLRMVQLRSQKGWRWRLTVFVFTNMTVKWWRPVCVFQDWLLFLSGQKGIMPLCIIIVPVSS